MKNYFKTAGSVLGVSAVLLFFSGCQFTADPFGEETSVPERSRDFYGERAPELPDVEPVIEPDTDEPLSLAECMQVAFQNSPVARSSWEMSRAEAMRIGQARSPLLPQLDITSSATRRMREQRDDDASPLWAGGTGLQEGDKIYTTQYDASFGVRQLLFDAGSTRAAVGSAEASLLRANLQHDSALLDIALETQTNYYRLLNSMALLEVARESLKQRERHLELAEARFEAGLVHEAEVLQARARKSEAELEIVDAENQIRMNRGRLATIMGLRPSREFEIRDIPEEIREEELADIAVLMDEAVEKRPALRASAAEVESLRASLKSEEAQRWPQLSGTGSFGRTDDKLRPRHEEWSLGLNLNWELFSGFDRTYRIREMERLIDRAVSEYERELLEVEREVWEAYSELLRAKDAISAADVFVDSAEESLRVAERAYEEGRVGIGELTDAEADATRARGRRVEARLDWHMAISGLERAIGRSMQQ